MDLIIEELMAGWPDAGTLAPEQSFRNGGLI